MTNLASISYIPHGGGPLPVLGDPGHAGLSRFLSDLPQQFAVPEAILVISAHWEEAQPTLTSGVSPELIYDYSGFPAAAYQLRYPAAGQPELAHEIANLLNAAGHKANLDDQRGFDHGLFIPLLLMYPEANIPCIQLSLTADLDPARHLDMGRALQPLLNKNLLILGSGLSFHNLRKMFSPDPQTMQAGQAFDQWLTESLTQTDLSQSEREARLLNWEQAPGSRLCHPREEHLLPVHVCAGMAGTAAKQIFNEPLFQYPVSGFMW